MRITHLTTHYLPITGGQEVYVDNLVRCLAARGHENTVIQLENTAAAGSTFTRVQELRRHRRLPVFVDFSLGIITARAEIARGDVTIVNYPEYLRFVPRKERAVVLSHGATWGSLTGKKRALKVHIARVAYEKAAVSVYNDSFAMREIGLNAPPGKGMFTWIDSKAFFLPNCVDTAKFVQTTPIPALAGLNAICVPRNLNYGRGVDLAIEAFAIVARERPETNLVVVGDSNIGDVAYRRSLFDRVNERGLQGRVYFLGSVSNDAMPRIYSSCALTLIPTRYREGTSLSALESMSCGTPALCTAVEGLLDLPAEHCLPEAGEMARAILAALERREELAVLQSAAVREGFGLERWAEAWTGVVERVGYR